MSGHDDIILSLVGETPNTPVKASIRLGTRNDDCCRRSLRTFGIDPYKTEKEWDLGRKRAGVLERYEQASRGLGHFT